MFKPARPVQGRKSADLTKCVPTRSNLLSVYWISSLNSIVSFSLYNFKVSKNSSYSFMTLILPCGVVAKNAPSKSSLRHGEPRSETNH